MITRAEAIELLKSLRFEDDETCSENMALDMAIASLETDEAYDLMYEQPEFCKDCISRKAVLNTLDNMDSALDDEDRTVETYKELLKECYKVLPSVTPQNMFE